ncbi:MAG: glycosyltransferase [Burkholderiales bacterium]
MRFRTGDFERALAAYMAALRLAPGFPVALVAQWGAATVRARLERTAAGAELAVASGPADAKLVSIVICSNNHAKYDKVVANFDDRLGSVPHEIIGIHDARSLCEGYNRGVARSRGEIIVFAHDDIRIVSPDFAGKLFASLAECDLVGVAGTTLLRSAGWVSSGWPFLAGQVGHVSPDGGRVVTVFGLQDRLVRHAQVLDGFFFATRRTVFERLRFDESTFDGWHFYDIDFTYSAFRAGLRLGIRTDMLLWHDSTASPDERWGYYAERFLRKHGPGLTAWDLGLKPQMVGVRLDSEQKWIAVTRHLYD